MAPFSETGHAKNVANFAELITFCTSLGTSYNPSNPHISIPSLQTKYTESTTVLQALIVAKTTYNNATNTRENIFKTCRLLATRILSALTAVGASSLTIHDARTINRKIQGKRKTNLKKQSPALTSSPPEEATSSDDHTISVSQQSYTSLTVHFENLLTLLSAQSLYAPHEPELSIVGLTTLITQMKAANATVAAKNAACSNARIDRNKTLYHKTTGLINLTHEVKNYIRSLFGTTSSQYKTISKIKFRSFNS